MHISTPQRPHLAVRLVLGLIGDRPRTIRLDLQRAQMVGKSVMRCRVYLRDGSAAEPNVVVVDRRLARARQLRLRNQIEIGIGKGIARAMDLI